MRYSRLLIILVVVLTASGCALFETRENRTALELAQEGMANYDSGNYAKAIDRFETLKDWYPFSKYAMLAELKIADAHYHRQEFEDAILAYEEFENLHPRNEAIPYVIYQIGRCYFDRMDTIDRDQSTAIKAIEVFQRLIQQFPDDIYAKRAGHHLTEALKTIAGHEFYVGMFYFKNKRYKAALNRFESVVTDYLDTGVHYEALRHIALCEEKLKQEG